MKTPIKHTTSRLVKRVLMMVGTAIAFLIIGLSFQQVVRAQSNPQPPTAQPAIQADTVKTAVSAVITTIDSAFQKLTNNSGIKDAGKSITYMLFTLVLVWNLLRCMVEGEGINGIVAALIPLFGTLAIITMLLDSNGVQNIVSFMDSLATSFGMQSELGAAIQNAIQKGFEAIGNIMTMPSLNTEIPFSLNPGPIIGVLISSLVAILARLLTALLVVVAVGFYLANIVLAQGSILLAVAMAPLMVPFILVQSLDFIFNGWLRFTLGAAMMKVVGAFMLGITDGIMAELVTLSKTVKLPPNSDYATIMIANYIVYAGLILMAGLCAYLMMMVPQLASGLLSGNGGQGFKNMKAITQSSGFRAGRSMTGVSDGVLRGAGGALMSRRDGAKGVADPAAQYGRFGGAIYKGLGGKITSKK